MYMYISFLAFRTNISDGTHICDNEIYISRSRRAISKRICADAERHYAGRNPGRYHTHERCHQYSLISITLIFSPLKSLLRDILSLRLLITPLPQRGVWGLCTAGMGKTGFYGTHQSEVCLRQVSPLSRI